MLIGVPREIKTEEHRVGLVPATVVVSAPDRIYERAELIAKVKDPLAPERRHLRRGRTIFADCIGRPRLPDRFDLPQGTTAQVGPGVAAMKKLEEAASG